MWRPKLYRGRWYAVAGINGKTERRALNTADWEEAQRAFKDFEAKLKKPNETITEIMDAYRDGKDFLSTKTLDFCIATLKPFWGHLRPEHVTRALCKKYIETRAVKNNTVRRELEVLRAALYWSNPDKTPEMYLPPAGPPKERSLTRDEYARLLDCAKSPHVRLFIVLALSTAGRESALLELTWDRIDFQRGAVRLANGQTSNKGRGCPPMNKNARAALEEAYRARTSDYVIEYGGKKVRTVIKGFKRVAEKAGLPDVTPHVLRHTAAVWMAEKRIPMSEISQYLGHTSTKITEKVYARYSPEHLRKAADALE